MLAARTFDRLKDVGISMEEVTDTLLADGVQLFSGAIERITRVIAEKSGGVTVKHPRQRTSSIARI